MRENFDTGGPGVLACRSGRANMGPRASGRRLQPVYMLQKEAIVAWTGRRGGSAAGGAPSEESALVEQAKVDPDAFGVLYDRYVDGVYRFVYNRVRNRQAAEDVTADVFVKALRAIGRYQSSGRPFGAWLYQIAANAAIDHARAFRPSVDLGHLDRLAATTPGPEETALGRVEKSRVWQLMAELPPAQQTALALRLGQDLSNVDIALVMGKSEGAVKVLVHRGIASLRSRLAEDPETGAGS
jgi:RNA polymerase sigma-70 factor (ECF subfamily)